MKQDTTDNLPQNPDVVPPPSDIKQPLDHRRRYRSKSHLIRRTGHRKVYFLCPKRNCKSEQFARPLTYRLLSQESLFISSLHSPHKSLGAKPSIHNDPEPQPPTTKNTSVKGPRLKKIKKIPTVYFSNDEIKLLKEARMQR